MRRREREVVIIKEVVVIVVFFIKNFFNIRDIEGLIKVNILEKKR